MKSISLCSLFVIGIIASNCKTIHQNSDPKFGGGEHLMLGDEGYRLAAGLATGAALDRIYRNDGQQEFTYGELVALSGDFYARADDIFFEEKQSIFDRLPGGKYNNVAAGIAAIKAEVPYIEKQKDLSGTEIVDQNVQFGKIFGTAYLEMALCNEDHFGWHNMKRYILEHEKALSFAKQAHDLSNQDKVQEKKLKADLYNRAIFQNAFADHFLTDGFASGHVRVPRRQAIQLNKLECPRPDTGILSKLFDLAIPNEIKRIGVMAKFQHDNDHALVLEDVNRETKIVSGGLMVKNSLDNSWKARPDNQLYLDANADDKAVRYAVEAVKLSVQEVLDVYRTGNLPSGIYKATELVPFIDPAEKSAVDTFSSLTDEQIAKILAPSNTAMEKLKGLFTSVDVAYARAYFKDLPKYMQQFRADVAADLQAPAIIDSIEVDGVKVPVTRSVSGETLKLRLPKSYIDGYLKVK